MAYGEVHDKNRGSLMLNYRVRNLRLAVIDDDHRKALISKNGVVDLVAFEPNPHGRISRLNWHVENAARQKNVRFDLLSIDVNFQEDDSDPMKPQVSASARGAGERFTENPRRMSASGLYHGLALLARRASVDASRNIMPLAWEVRTLAPDVFNQRDDLQRDVLRGYGLVRGLLARPRADESLIACIKREHAELKLGGELKGDSLFEVLLGDLTALAPSNGRVDDILPMLLPRWRRAFMDAVRRKDVALHIPELRVQQERLESVPVAEIPTTSELCVPIRGKNGEVAYGIRLVSIMGDQISATGALNVAARTEGLVDLMQQSKSVREWVEELAATASSQWEDTFRDVAAAFERAIQGGGLENVGTLWESAQHERRLMLYILMRTRIWVMDTAGKRNPKDEALAAAYGLPVHTQTFNRPLKANKIVTITPGELRRTLVEALSTPEASGTNKLSAIGIWHGWLRSALRSYCLGGRTHGGLGLQRGVLRDRAPGLEGGVEAHA
jgi:hypothetical protein